MAITASQITSSQTLEEFRLEFNKLQSDVTILKDNPTYGTSIVFEGATADAYETTITVTDPTVDRTITVPNVTGTLVTTGDTNTVTGTAIAADTVAEANMADDAIGSDQLKTLSTLLIKNSGGTTLKTLYGAGA